MSVTHAGPPLTLDSLVRAHLHDSVAALQQLAGQAEQVARWSCELAGCLRGGGRVLVAGNGGSAAEAQHLSGELVGRYRDERAPLSAIALHCDTSTLTALVNDYGIEEMFARQVRAHGRPGDLLVLLSTSGRSRNLLSAAAAAREQGVRSWAITGPLPNPLVGACDDALPVSGHTTAAVQEAQLALVHMLCECLEPALAAAAV